MRVKNIIYKHKLSPSRTQIYDKYLKMTEANARIKINKLLEKSDWILPVGEGVEPIQQTLKKMLINS